MSDSTIGIRRRTPLQNAMICILTAMTIAVVAGPVDASADRRVPTIGNVPANAVNAVNAVNAQPVTNRAVVARPAKLVAKVTAVAAKKTRRPTTTRATPTTRPKRRAATTTTRRPRTTTPLRVTSTLPSTVVAEGGDVGNPSANGTVPVPVSPVPAVSIAVVPVVTTSSIPPVATSTTLAPFPAPANLPTRATASLLTPYYGLGTWIDSFDWTVQKGGKTPKVSSGSVDAMAAAGVQTLFVQAARFDSADVAEPERLLPIINRAHELGMYVVAWYLPTFTDVNADLRRTVAIANLDIDGISIDIEARNVTDVLERNRRLTFYSQSLRSLLPGRFISNNIVQPNILEAVPNLWPTEYGKPPVTPTSYWTPFPYIDIAPYYDLWMIQSYWTQRSTGGGWRDAYKISVDNASRLRSILGRPDLPIYLIGGVGDRPLTINDLSGWLQAHIETRSVGASFYDWLVTPAAWWPGMWSMRYVPPGQAVDPRFIAVPPPAYIAPVQPVLVPPTMTIPTTSPTTIPGGTASPTFPGSTIFGTPTTTTPVVVVGVAS